MLRVVRRRQPSVDDFAVALPGGNKGIDQAEASS